MTRTRTSQAVISSPRNCSFDTFQDTCNWYSDYNNNNNWIQTNGNMSSYVDLLGPGSDYTSISNSF